MDGAQNNRLGLLDGCLEIDRTIIVFIEYWPAQNATGSQPFQNVRDVAVPPYEDHAHSVEQRVLAHPGTRLGANAKSRP